MCVRRRGVRIRIVESDIVNNLYIIIVMYKFYSIEIIIIPTVVVQQKAYLVSPLTGLLRDFDSITNSQVHPQSFGKCIPSRCLVFELHVLYYIGVCMSGEVPPKNKINM